MASEQYVCNYCGLKFDRPPYVYFDWHEQPVVRCPKCGDTKTKLFTKGDAFGYNIKKDKEGK